MSAKKTYSFVVTHHDAPGDDRGTVENRTAFLTEDEASALSARATRLFDEHGDGNDNWYEFELTELKPEDTWTAAEFSAYLDKFAEDEDIEEDD